MLLRPVFKVPGGTAVFSQYLRSSPLRGALSGFWPPHGSVLRIPNHSRATTERCSGQPAFFFWETLPGERWKAHFGATLRRGFLGKQIQRIGLPGGKGTKCAYFTRNSMYLHEVVQKWFTQHGVLRM